MKKRIRSEMPQFNRSGKKGKKDTDNRFAKIGFKTTMTKKDPSSLKHSQTTTSQQKVNKKAKDGSYKKRFVVASKDGYIIDGHHDNEAAKMNNDKIDVLKVNKKASQILKERFGSGGKVFMFKKGGWVKKVAKGIKERGTEGTFTSYCKRLGYDGVTESCIKKGKSSKNPKTRKRATLAKTFRSMKK